MLASVLGLLASTAAAQGDPTVEPRENLVRCLNELVRSSRQQNMAPEAFDTTLAQACSAERAAYRAAIIRREKGYGASAALASEDADLDLEDTNTNFQGVYRMHHEAGSVPE